MAASGRPRVAADLRHGGIPQRREEFETKISAAIEATFGDDKADMMLLRTLCTRRSKQGHGYGTAMVKFVTDKVRFAAMTLSTPLTCTLCAG